jgi:LmbE family N-acetylglucosaminyl deacetylase
MNIIDQATLTAPARHILLSPHYDDIALSIGGTTRLLALAGTDAQIALINGSEPDPNAPLTAFAEELHTAWGFGPREVVSSRRAEEAAAAATLGVRDVYLPFHDAIYRGERYVSNSDLFGAPKADEADLHQAIIATLGLPATADGSVRIYAPCAIGFHVDHQHAFLAGVALARQGWEVWFYEDLPYALKPGSRDTRFARNGVALTEAGAVDVSSVWQTKLDAIFAYPSQLETVFAYVNHGCSRAEIDAVMRDYALESGGGIIGEHFWKLA